MRLLLIETTLSLPAPAEPILGAAQVHAVLTGWRQALQGAPARNDRDRVPAGDLVAD